MRAMSEPGDIDPELLARARNALVRFQLEWAVGMSPRKLAIELDLDETIAFEVVTRLHEDGHVVVLNGQIIADLHTLLSTPYASEVRQVVGAFLVAIRAARLSLSGSVSFADLKPRLEGFRLTMVAAIADVARLGQHQPSFGYHQWMENNDWSDLADFDGDVETFLRYRCVEVPSPSKGIHVEEPLVAHDPHGAEDAPFIPESLEPEDDLGDAPGDTSQPLQWPVSIVKLEKTIFELLRRIDEGVLDLQPEFQRSFVWTLPLQVSLIESVLARIPLPVIYLSEEDEEKTLVIDGQQRLTTLHRFAKGDFALKNLHMLPELEGKRFGDLDGKLRRRFEDTPITTFVIQPGSDAKVKFEIFERLNRGAIVLNAQEIRNSLLRGPGLLLAQELGGYGGLFRKLARESRSFPRMREDELALRCLAFLDSGPDEYSGDMKDFLNARLRRLNDNSEEHRAALANALSRALEETQAVFGDISFRRWDPAKKRHASAMNAALMDVTVYGFAKPLRPADFWAARADDVRSRLERLHANLDFARAITVSTGSSSAVKTRFRLWMKELDDAARDHA